MSANQNASKLDMKFYADVSGMIEDIAPDVCDFDDVPEFAKEFGALCEKYRALHNARNPERPW